MFDVIISNPPYQLRDGGAKGSAKPIYHKFIQRIKKLNPKFIIMIIPSRWFAGGKGLTKFRSEMLNDDRVRKLIDFEDATECFPSVDIAGGICYFMWERDNPGLCEVVNVLNGVEVISERPLNEYPIFVRHGKAVPIIRKVLGKSKRYMDEQVSSRKPFGLATNIRPQKSGDITLRWQKGEGPYTRKDITTGVELIDEWKIVTAYTSYDHSGNPDKDGRRRVFSTIYILPPGVICTETYLVIGSYKKKHQAINLYSYMNTLFFRFLVSQFICSQHITKRSYSFVPILDMDVTWTDELLFKRYGITENEIAVIKSKIK